MDKDKKGWNELLKIWSYNLVGMNDDTLAKALGFYIRCSHKWKDGKTFAPGPGDLWVALDEFRRAEEGQAEQARTSGHGTRRYNPNAPDASEETVDCCWEQLRQQFPNLKRRQRKCTTTEDAK